MSFSGVRFAAVVFALTVVETAAAAVITAGYTDLPPQFERSRDGHPAGFVVDVVKEAGVRTGTQIRWKFVERAKVLASLRSGEIDIWPAGVSTPQRLTEFHITTAWWKTKLLLVTHSATRLEDLAGKQVGHTRDLANQIRTAMPNAAPVEMATHVETMSAVCEGRLDAALMDRLILDTLLLHRPRVCVEKTLYLVGVPDTASLELAIISRKDKQTEADRLRFGVEQAAADGTLAEIALAYPSVAAASSTFVAALAKSYQRYLMLRTIGIGIAVLLAACLCFIILQRKEILRRRRTEYALRETSADLRKFAYAAHHDLQEPIRNIKLYGQLLERQYSSNGAHDENGFFGVLISNAQRMHNLLEAIRCYTQIATEAPQELTTFNATDCLHQACALLSREIRETGAKIIAEPLPRVHYNQQHLVQVFEQLISNSLRFRGTAPPEISVRCTENPDWYSIEVADNGIGIAPEYQHRIFDVFKRLHGPEVAGSGVGLAVCKRIVETAGGRIFVTSEGPGKGSVFMFTIPRGTRPSARSGQEALSASEKRDSTS